jgi:hypothetical protein
MDLSSIARARPTGAAGTVEVKFMDLPEDCFLSPGVELLTRHHDNNLKYSAKSLPE